MALAFNPLSGGLELIEEGLNWEASSAPNAVDVGDVVCVVNEDSSGLPVVALADIGDDARMPAVGVVVAKLSPTSHIIVSSGPCEATGLIPGRACFVGAGGQLTQARPHGVVGAGVWVQVLGIAVTTTRLLLKPQGGMTKVLS